MLCVNILDGLLQKVTVYFLLAQLKLLAKARYSLAKFKGEEIVILSQVSYTFFENPCLNEFFTLTSLKKIPSLPYSDLQYLHVHLSVLDLFDLSWSGI